MSKRYTLELRNLRERVEAQQLPGETTLSRTILRLLELGIDVVEAGIDMKEGVVVELGALKPVLEQQAQAANIPLDAYLLLLISRGMEQNPPTPIRATIAKYSSNPLWQLINRDREMRQLSVSEYTKVIVNRFQLSLNQYSELKSVVSGEQLPSDDHLLFLGSFLSRADGDRYSVEELANLRDRTFSSVPTQTKEHHEEITQ